MGADRNMKHTELLLVRVWRRQGGKIDPTRDAAGLRGRVQRVVDGEAYDFNGWQGLLDAVAALLFDSSSEVSTSVSQEEEG
jgi:hypothetical protein